MEFHFIETNMQVDGCCVCVCACRREVFKSGLCLTLVYHFHVGGRVFEILHKKCPLRYFARGGPFFCFCIGVFFQ